MNNLPQCSEFRVLVAIGIRLFLKYFTVYQEKYHESNSALISVLHRRWGGPASVCVCVWLGRGGGGGCEAAPQSDVSNF